MRREYDVTIRFAYRDDADSLAQLRERAGRRLSGGPLLVAEVHGSICAAVEFGGAGALADPRLRTTDLVSLLRHRMYQLHGVPMPPGLVDRLLTPELPDPAWFER